MKDRRKPHRCPVCEGKGRMPPGFYSVIDMIPTEVMVVEDCRACSGSGIVWEPEQVKGLRTV